MIEEGAIGTRRSADAPTVPVGPERSRAFSAAVVTAYVVLGVAVFWPVLPGISHRILGGGIESHDYVQSVWFIGWIAHALAHGINPLFSHAILAPTGTNLAQNTSSPLLALVATPLTLAFGPLVATNLLLVLAMPVSATAAFIVLRKWNVWSPAAAVGGLLYGFSPFMLTQGQAHVELVFVPLPPFIALTIASLLQRRGSPRKLGLQLGVLVAAQYLISPEVLAAVTVFVVIAVAAVAVRHRSELPQAVRDASRPLTVALVVGGILVAYPVWMMLFGPRHFTGAAWPAVNAYHNDLFSFVVPGFAQTGGNSIEASGYIGVPLLLLGAVFGWRSRRSPRVQLTLVLLAGAVLLSLGPHLTVDRHLTALPLPFLLVDHIPLLYDILPSRMSFEMDALLAALIAFGLDDAYRSWAERHESGLPARSPGLRRWPVVATLLAMAAVIFAIASSWPTSSSADATVALPAALRRAIPTGDPIAVTYPYDTLFDMRPMLWQAEDDFKFRLIGGYAYYPGSGGRATFFAPAMQPEGLQAFLLGQDTPNAFFSLFYGPTLPLGSQLVAKTRTALAENDVRLVIVDRSVRGGAAAEQLFRTTLGPPTLSAEGFSLWTVPHSPAGNGCGAPACPTASANRRQPPPIK